MTWALAGLLLIAPVWAWKIGHRWPPSLRDNALLTVGLMVSVGLVPVCWPLAILWTLALVHWNDPDRAYQPDFHPPITGLLAIGSMIALFLLAARVPPGDRWMLRWAILSTGFLQLGVLAWQAYHLWHIRKTHRNFTFHTFRDGLRGSMANRVVTGALLAFCLALAPPALMPVFGLGILAVNSYTALAGAMVGLLIRFPPQVLSYDISGLTVHLGPLVLLCVVAAVLGLVSVGFWRGNPLDSARGRRSIWALTLETWLDYRRLDKLVGQGHFAFAHHARWWQSRQAVRDEYRQAHCDILQFLLEYGIVGVGAVLCWLGLVSRGFAAGDPWTAAIVTALVISLNQFTLHLPHSGFAVVVAAGVVWSRF
jgi:hypothetical protein